MRLIRLIVALVFGALLWLVACQKTRPVLVSVVPLQEGSEMSYVGYVTDGQFNLVSQLHPFTRKYAGSKLLNGKKVHLFVSENDTTPFVIGKDGSVSQLAKENLSVRVVPYGFRTDGDVVISYWEPLLKQHRGTATRWDMVVDTTFAALDSSGQKNLIQYLRIGRAKFDGWTDVTVPQRRDQPYRVVAVTWPEINQYLINITTGDTLFATEGSARQFFEPTFGVIRYMTDFRLKEKGKDPLFRRGTWDLTKVSIPKK